ncbi:MAG: DUF1836 domain-containing protein [Lachnospiraceae bacterium]|nr:DUF1836 domain-containing protein [Lachnospiraceae bacterium]
MTLDMEDLINSIMASLGRIDFIDPEDIPNIDLYMDQVTSFIDTHLKNTARHQGTERILTKTMINNYAKNDLLPPPEKKKYNKEHILLLIFIYYFKNILSISDIQQMLGPMAERYFGKDGKTTIASIYDEVIGTEREQIGDFKEDILEKFHKSRESFPELEEGEEKEFLQLFSFICMLSFDVYVKKLMIEKIIDGYAEKKGPAAAKQKARREGRKKTRHPEQEGDQ